MGLYKQALIDSDSVQSNSETITSTSNCSTLEELQEFIDRSYQDVSLRSDIHKNNISFVENINSSTPFKSIVADCSTPTVLRNDFVLLEKISNSQ